MATLLRNPNTRKYSMSLEDDKVRVGVTAMQGWRPEMEDAHLVSLELPFRTDTGSKRNLSEAAPALHEEDGALFGVFDGHCGAKVAHVAAHSMEQWITETDEFKKNKFGPALTKAFLKGDRQMQEDLPMVQSGCTANVVMMAGFKLLCANAGDTRAILSRGGQVVPLSEDHKPNNKTEIQRIAKAGGFVSPQGRVYGILALSRALGDFMFKSNKELGQEEQVVSCEPDIVELDITIEDEFVLLACDGIWDVLSSEEAADFVRGELNDHGDVCIAAEKLVDRCLAPNYMGKGTDNMSVILVQFKSSFLSMLDPFNSPDGGSLQMFPPPPSSSTAGPHSE